MESGGNIPAAFFFVQEAVPARREDGRESAANALYWSDCRFWNPFKITKL